MRISLKIGLLLVFFSTTYAQDYNLTGNWIEIGPLDNPDSKNQSSAGIGPVEFIKISHNNPDLMLAGSLKGGLFTSDNGGVSWHNAGSDQWTVSNCGWAEIHPEDDNLWFAVSMRDGYKGGPGDIGKNGGIYRTKNKGTTWESVAKYSVFENSTNTVIYGLRFHPANTKKMYVMTSKGLFFTEDCTADYLEWTKVKYIDGSIYDLEVNHTNLCFSLKSKNKWKVLISEGQKLLPITEVSTETRVINTITIEKYNEKFYFLIDFKDSKDEVWEYSPSTKEVKVVYHQGMISFGAGYAFAINPHNGNEIMVGKGVRVRKWLIKEQRYSRIDSDYHVDVECISYHPTDSNVMYIGTHGGVFKTEDQGASWQFMSEGLGNAEVHALSVSSSDPRNIAIGLNHDGTLINADWNRDGHYSWKQVNGGDALIPIINPLADSIVYTSNQYSGGGLYYSSDTAKHNRLIHSNGKLKTPGWSMAAKLHPTNDSIIFFNYAHSSGRSKGNIDIVRSVRPHDLKKVEVISNFGESHQLKSYQVFKLFTSEYHPDLLFAYVISNEKREGKQKKVHRLFMLPNSLDSSKNIIQEWKELELPRNDWVGGLVVHPKKWFKLYISYTSGVPVKVSAPDEKGMIYHMKYRKSDFSVMRNWDISANIPSTKGGGNNIILTPEKNMFIATSSGVYIGTKSTLRGGKSWKTVGDGTVPSCKVSGLLLHPEKNILTVSYDGRGVWQINLSNN